jgi:AcrR family transcriptional regulator
MARGRALTTTAIATEAGLAQPTFYAYFTSVDAIRLAAVQDAVHRLEHAAAERRAQTRAVASDFERQVNELAHWLATARSYGDIHSIYERYADEESVVGETLRALGESHIARLSEDLFRAAALRGVTADHYAEFRVLAISFNASVGAVARAVHRGLVHDISQAARVLMRSQWAGFGALVEACGGSTDPIAAASMRRSST